MSRPAPPSPRRALRQTLAALTVAAAILGGGALLAGPTGRLLLGLAEPLRALRLPLTRGVVPGPVVLEQMQQLQRLETSRYQGQVVVRGESARHPLPAWLSGDRMLFVARGEVVAGIDLARLRPEDIAVRNGEVEVRLPTPEIFHAAVNAHTSEVYERRTGWFGGPDPQLETEVRREAEERIREAALRSGVLAAARRNAEEALRRHLGPLGFREVRFS
jgi:hypothetical protein